MQATKLTNYDGKAGWSDYWSVTSDSNPDRSYIVAKHVKNGWGCSCPRWIYHREECKHINVILRLIHMNDLLSTKPPTRPMTEREMIAVKKVASRFSLVEID